MTQRSETGVLELASLAALPAGCVLAWVVARWGNSGPIAVHFGLDGRPNGWMSAGHLAAVMLVLALLLGLPPLWIAYVKRTTSASLARRLGLTFGQAICGITALLTNLMLAWLSGALGTPMRPALLPAALSVMLMAIGALLGRVPPNALIGVRTRATRESRLAWDRSNRLAGRLFLTTGVAGLLACIAGYVASIGVQVVGIAVSTVLALREARRAWEEERK
jgi:uncharacterized membrane protein